MNWEPISTAPKDGTKIILCYRHCEILIGHWHQPGNPERHGFWTSEGRTSEKSADFWMPLPPPPTEEPNP